MSDLRTRVQDAIDEVVRANGEGHTGADAVRRNEAALCMFILAASGMLHDMDHPPGLGPVFRSVSEDILNSLVAASIVANLHYAREEVRE